MSTVIDHDMEKTAHALWKGPLRLACATGGLFNRVVRVEAADSVHYLKRFTDSASSGEFPPLPTTSRDRCLVAASWHDLAARAALGSRSVDVPPLLAIDTQTHVIAMAGAAGEPLYDALVGRPALPDVLGPLIVWMAQMHLLPLEPRTALIAASAPFKAFKVDLQYTRVLPEIPDGLHAAGRVFIASYLAADAEAVHGDLNSRNLLVGAEDRAAVIDFEQGHFGEGVYDLAYLLSEYVLRDIRLGRDPEPILHDGWRRYLDARNGQLEHGAGARFRVHTAFQALYRLVGPSRKIWSGNLDEDAASRVRAWCIAQLAKWLR